MLTIGSVTRDAAASRFEFLAERFRGRRAAIREFTHRAPDYVFWIYPDGTLHDARDSHLRNPPSGFEHIVHDEPHYGGFLRGRVASNGGEAIVVVYCVPEALASDASAIAQLLAGLDQLPIPLDDTVLVISDNGDLYGTIGDVRSREQRA